MYTTWPVMIGSFLLGGGNMESVTEYLERARECADMADKMTGRDNARLMEIADAWLKLAGDAAKEALAPGNAGVKALDQDRLTRAIKRKS